MFDRLYTLNENCQVHFVGFASEVARYDIAIVFTEQFFGKPLVVCMQTGKSALLSAEDLSNVDYLQKTFNTQTKQEAKELSILLQKRLPMIEFQDQY
ncbi:DUF3055 domain-containing protein [Longirhabdus pacifica]|uniref:DUF3055 domain-containing protein n=1 Tax=Longirhabdus pacifica TaxID=2305227 RepID=UPI0010088224|nr:DUF3055 domain-containing protein [Longirhabdus pacifica]